MHNPTPYTHRPLGAPMGRRDHGMPMEGTRVSLRRIRINRSGYDSGGAYWGLGQPLYWAGTDDGRAELFFRASTREAARMHVSQTWPGVRFTR